MTRPCPICKETKPEDQFRPGRKECKQCAYKRSRAWLAAHPGKQSAYREKFHGKDPTYTLRGNLLRSYGMTLEAFDGMVEAQGGRCMICGELPEQGERLHVDHDHSTGKVRALLCRVCNVGLGHFKDDRSLLRAAADYLARF